MFTWEDCNLLDFFLRSSITSLEKRCKAGKEEMIFGTGPLWMLRLTGVYASLWWFQQALLRLTPSWEKNPYLTHCFPHRLKPPASIFSLCLCHVYPKGNLKVDEFSVTNQLVGWFVVQSKMDTFFGPSIVYSSIRVDQIWLWDFWSLGDVFTQIKSSIQSRINKNLSFETPPIQTDSLTFLGGLSMSAGWLMMRNDAWPSKL